LWQHPRDKSKDNNQLEYWIELAKVLEDGKFHGIFIADVLGIYDVYKGPGNIAPALKGAASIPIIDPLYVGPRKFYHLLSEHRLIILMQTVWLSPLWLLSRRS
jgi:alkanesulfonate monooxygenase SsuD/methylene tetrahydromethanopterin reductase-like flavin-dependent oxidoreductase (luciferase family)